MSNTSTHTYRIKLILSGLLILLLTSPTHARQVYSYLQNAPDYQPLASSIEVPVQLSLQPWTKKIEQLTPVQAGHWRSWKRKHGLEAKYRAWRGPLLLQADGDSILMQAHVRYWLKGRTRLPGPFDISTSCGVNEAPRQAVIGVRVKFEWQSDWTLQPSTQVLPTRFLDRCQITSLNLDVTPIIGELFNRELKKSIQNTLGQLDNDLKNIRQQAARLWKHVNQPVKLANQSWLKLQPMAIAVSPFFGYGEQLTTHIKVSLQPQLLHGNKPATEHRTLPPLGRFYPGANRLNIHLSLPLDYAKISQQLSQVLAEHQFNIKGHPFTIRNVALAANDSRLRAAISLSGATAGKAEVSGKLNSAPPPEWLSLDSLEYQFEPEDMHLKILAKLFNDRIRQQLEIAANDLIRQQIQLFKTQLQAYFQAALPDQLKVHFDDLQLTATDVDLHASGLVFNGMIYGTLRLEHN